MELLHFVLLLDDLELINNGVTCAKAHELDRKCVASWTLWLMGTILMNMAIEVTLPGLKNIL